MQVSPDRGNGNAHQVEVHVKPPRIAKIQVMTLSFLVITGVINLFDRTSLSIANTTIRQDLGLSAMEIGMFLSAFSLAYGIAQLPSGLLLDRFGPRRILGAGLFFWSAIQSVTGLVSGFWTFFALRIGLGVGEAPFMPTGVKAISEWFPRRRRGLPMGIVNSSIVLGSAISPPILSTIMIAFGWRFMFVVIGLLGLAFGVVWVVCYRDRRALALSQEEMLYLNQDSPAAQLEPITVAEWGGLFRQRTIWGMIIGNCGVNYTVWLYTAWLPGYLQAIHHLSLAQTGWATAVPFIFGGAGMLSDGVVVDWLAARGVPMMRCHRTLLCTGMVCSALCTALATQASTPTAAVLIVGMAYFCIQFAGTSGWGLAHIAAPPRMVASVGAIQNFGGFTFASLGPVIAGWLLDRTGSFDIALFICASVAVVGAMSYAFVVKDPIRDPRLADGAGL
jgi:sugar phosphate permease